MKIKKGVEVNLGLGTHYELHMDNVLSFVDVTLEVVIITLTHNITLKKQTMIRKEKKEQTI
jgi:hypothetical protein